MLVVPENKSQCMEHPLKLWEIAHAFCDRVCVVLRSLSAQERLLLRGDYLFFIDSKPHFVVTVDVVGAWSVLITQKDNHSFHYIPEPASPSWVLDADHLSCMIATHSARSTLFTQSQTLYKILTGTLKARLAFASGKVTIKGDFCAFLKMVSLLKQNGVRPQHEAK